MCLSLAMVLVYIIEHTLLNVFEVSYLIKNSEKKNKYCEILSQFKTSVFYFNIF